MSLQADRANRFRELHRPGAPLLIPNPWDMGSAKLLASLGFQALATTSSGYAATLGRLDGSISGEEALEHSATIVSATALPVSADLENGFADSPEGVAETARGAVAAGLAGFSIEDFSGDPRDPIYDRERAVARIRAAAEVAHAGPASLVLTARAENHLHGVDDLDDTIARLQAYADAGADVLYAPGPTDAEQLRAIVAAVDRPVNVLARTGSPPVATLAALGVSRISVGGSFAFAAIEALVSAGQELLHDGTYGFTERSAAGASAARRAFG
ncbi:MAG: isocitrate lyase/PEP mutase family protein [Solirubrobacteraceae bacterium]